jgi:hypothetical protein
MPLVEVGRAAAADDASLVTVLAVTAALKKNGVLVKDSPAFVVNRLLTRPFHLGGITPFLDRSGIAEKIAGTRFRP